MSNYIKGKTLLQTAEGISVYRTAAVLPSSTIGNIFTVSGGRVLIIALTGIVSTTLSGTNSTTVGITPTYNTTSAPSILSSAGVIPTAAGSPFSSKLDGGALVVTVNGSLQAAAPYLTVPGTITITTASTVTGTVEWDLIYLPFDNGAYVTAA